MLKNVPELNDVCSLVNFRRDQFWASMMSVKPLSPRKHCVVGVHLVNEHYVSCALFGKASVSEMIGYCTWFLDGAKSILNKVSLVKLKTHRDHNSLKKSFWPVPPQCVQHASTRDGARKMESRIMQFAFKF